MRRTINCQNCQAELHILQRSLACPQCSANSVEFVYSPIDGKSPEIQVQEEGIWRYEEFLPPFAEKITLREGSTPIRKALRIFKGKLELSLKIEGKNPTGSFLDRVSPLMVSDALSQKKDSLVCASDGNLGASLSAYCAAAQLKCFCVVPKSTSPEKRTQMQAFGAEVVDYGETIDDSLDLAKKMMEKGRYQATPEFNILTIEGSKTIALEVLEQIYLAKESKEIDYIVVPMGSGSLLYSIWKGFTHAKTYGMISSKVKLPKIIGVQVAGFDPIVQSLDGNGSNPISNKKSYGKNSVADAMLVKKSTFGEKALQSILESTGTAVSVNEKEIISASKILGRQEGIFAELSSATVIAAIEKLHKNQYLTADSRVLALITSSGLKTSRAFQRSTTQDKRVESFRSMGTKVEILRIINLGTSDFGYGIWKSLGQTISLQAVYQHLKEMVNRDFIREIDSTNRQKKYALTEKGKKLILKMKELEELLD